MIEASGMAIFILLTTDGVVLDAEKLTLVVSRDSGVRVHITWEHGQVARQICTFHSSSFFSLFDLFFIFVER